jgi:hypothetical protein
MFMNFSLEKAAKITVASLGLVLAVACGPTYISYEYAAQIINPSDSVCVNGLLIGNRSSEVAMPGETKTFTLTFGRHNGVPTLLLGLSAECRTKEGTGRSERDFLLPADTTERTIIVKPSTTAPDYQVTAPGPTIELVK